MSRVPIRLLITLLFLLLAGCTEYQPPFTHHLKPEMDFDTVKAVAAQKGYTRFSEVGNYKGYCLLCFKKADGGEDVYLIINTERKPVLRTLGYGQIDEKKLQHFVEDLIKHNKCPI
ncbi:MAG: hypothetical protein KQH63_16845 [Desulfobulbaceae bacterium]|nr:hypothetical protein [Desulfobulbaceae bacterium]